MRGIEADLAERRVDQSAPLARGGADAVNLESFAHDLGDGQPRGQGSVGVLEDDLHLAAKRAQCRPRSPWISRPPNWMVPAARGQAQEGQTQGGLARAALAHHAHRLTFAHGEGDAVDRLDVAHRAPQHAALDGEPHAHVLGGHDDRRVGGDPVGRPARLGL